MMKIQDSRFPNYGTENLISRRRMAMEYEDALKKKERCNQDKIQ